MIEQAFVLAGGKGERLRPLTDHKPKPLVEVRGKPILEYCVENLAEQGIERIILSTGYLHETIEEYFKSGEKWGIDISYIVEEEPLGTGGALKNAEKMLAEKFCMLNGDNIANFSVSKMSAAFSNDFLACLSLVEVEDVSQYGVAKIEQDRIVDFVEKPNKEEAPSNLVNAGCYIIQKSALKLLPGGFNLIEKTLFPKLAAMNKLSYFKHEGYWFTTDNHERLGIAEKGLENQ